VSGNSGARSRNRRYEAEEFRATTKSPTAKSAETKLSNDTVPLAKHVLAAKKTVAKLRKDAVATNRSGVSTLEGKYGNKEDESALRKHSPTSALNWPNAGVAE
jgi:hypothetical protein